MRIHFLYVSGVYGSAKKLHKVAINKMLFIFFAARRPVMRFHPTVGSTFIHRIVALPALSGRSKSEYAVPTAIKGNYMGLLYTYLSIYISI